MTRAILGSEATWIVAGVRRGVSGVRFGARAREAAAGAPAAFAEARAVAEV
jgi:hypothetical protein